MKSIVELFCDMVRIDSESGDEGAFVEYVSKLLAEEFDADCRLDAYGNLVAKIAANGSQAAPVALCAHADTVKPGVGIEPIIGEDGVIRSKGETILGADDKAGLAQILEGIQSAARRPPVEIVLTLGEEVGLLGSRNLDVSLIDAKVGFVVDGEHLHDVVIGGPTHIGMDITVIGRAAHAGMRPEEGISAVRVAASAIARMPEGRIDEETTANVGTIEGGVVRNGVPERCTLKAECRSLNDQKAVDQARKMREAFEAAASKVGARVEIEETVYYRAHAIDPTAPVVRAACDAIHSIGLEPDVRVITGGTDALILCNRGMETVVLGTGGYDAHATTEYISIENLERGGSLIRSLLESLA